MLFLAAATASCPFPSGHLTAIATKRDLPPTVVLALGPLADKGEPFQASDSLPPGQHPPFRRFVSAEGRGCELMLRYEQGGIAHLWRQAHLRFNGRNWVVVTR